MLPQPNHRLSWNSGKNFGVFSSRKQNCYFQQKYKLEIKLLIWQECPIHTGFQLRN